MFSISTSLEVGFVCTKKVENVTNGTKKNCKQIKLEMVLWLKCKPRCTLTACSNNAKWQIIYSAKVCLMVGKVKSYGEPGYLKQFYAFFNKVKETIRLV